MKYHFRVSPLEDGRFLVQCVEMFFCSTCVNRIDDAPKAAHRALHKHLREPSPHILFASPICATLDALCDHFANSFTVVTAIFSVPVEPRVAFAISLRRLRTERVLHQSDMARRLGLRGRSAYQRLEDPCRANPTFETVERLREILPKLDVGSLFEPRWDPTPDILRFVTPTAAIVEARVSFRFASKSDAHVRIARM